MLLGFLLGLLADSRPPKFFHKHYQSHLGDAVDMTPDLSEGEGAAGGDILDPGAGGRVGGQAAQQPPGEGLPRQVGLSLPGAELAEPRRGHNALKQKLFNLHMY